jgi:hypothetical protein
MAPRCTKRLLPDRQRAPVEPLGVGVLALAFVHAGQVVEVEVAEFLGLLPREHLLDVAGFGGLTRRVSGDCGRSS